MADTKITFPSKIKREENGNIILTITLPQEEIKKIWDDEVKNAVSHAKMPGFREGKAPKDMVEDKLDKEAIREEVLKKILPTAYVEAINTHSLKPIMTPRIHVEKIIEGEDWTFTATTCEMVEVTLGDYTKDVKDVTAKTKIIQPGETEPQKPKLDDIVTAVLTSATATIPQVLVESEAERLLSQLLSEIKKLGLTLDQYLASTGKTAEAVQKDYEEKARHDLLLEFTLQTIADEKKIEVGQQELDDAVASAKTPEEKEAIVKNAYLVATILRQQKTLDYLAGL